MIPSKEDLIAIVREYYSPTNEFLFTTELSPEAERRQILWEKWIANMDSWYEFRRYLKSSLPDHITGETYSSADGGPRCMIYTPKDLRLPKSNWHVVGCVSLLAPVYFVHGVEWDLIDGRRRNPRARFEPPPPNMAWPAQAIARAIEKIFGCSAFPREWVETPVHLYAGLLEPPETTLFHTLFTNDPANIP